MIRSFSKFESSLVLKFATALLAASAIGCASSSKSDGNQPTAPVGSAGDTQPARLNTTTGNAVYNVPVPADARGQVIVNSVGITNLTRAGKKKGKKDSTMKLPTLHVQMIVKNDHGVVPWTVDARLQQVRFDVNAESAESTDGSNTKARSGDGLRPTFVSSAKGEALPLVNVAPGQTKKIELFYALPVDQRGPLDHQNFALDWQLVTDKTTINNSTVFISIARVTDPVAIAPGEKKKEKPMPVYPDAYAPGVMAPAGMENDWWQNPASAMPATYQGF